MKRYVKAVSADWIAMKAIAMKTKLNKDVEDAWLDIDIFPGIILESAMP
mgnify:CR=1